MRFIGLDHIDNVVNDFLAFADHERINEGMHRFRIGCGMSARDDDGMRFVAVCRTNGDAGKVEDIERVSIKGFVGQGKAYQVEAA